MTVRKTAKQVQRDLRVRAAVAGCVMSAVATVSSAQSPLASHRWENRLLIAFSATQDDGRLQATRDLATANAAAFADRDLVAGAVLEESGSIGDRSLSASERDGLRKQFGVEAGEFAVILVGKDGGEKLRLDRSPRSDELFGLIDSMPMRMWEMQSAGPGPDDDESG